MTKKDTLSPAYVAAINKQARMIGKAEQIKSRRQWLVAEIANDEWTENAQYYQHQGMNQDDFNALTSQAINKALGWTLITETGNTLKVWREVVAQFAEVRGVDAMKSIPFDYFRKARKLWNMSEHGETIKKILYPVAPIAEAIAMKLDAAEMYALYTDPVAAVNALQANPSWTIEKKAAFADALEEFKKEWFE